MEKLFYEIESRDMEDTWELLQDGADYEAKDHYGETALFKAVRQKERNIIKQLLQSGASVSERNDGNSTPFFVAVELYSPIDILEILINAGADIDIQDKGGFTPLMIALQNCDLETLTFLIKKNANRNIKNNQGKSVLDLFNEPRQVKGNRRAFCFDKENGIKAVLTKQ